MRRQGWRTQGGIQALLEFFSDKGPPRSRDGGESGYPAKESAGGRGWGFRTSPDYGARLTWRRFSLSEVERDGAVGVGTRHVALDGLSDRVGGVLEPGGQPIRQKRNGDPAVWAADHEDDGPDVLAVEVGVTGATSVAMPGSSAAASAAADRTRIENAGGIFKIALESSRKGDYAGHASVGLVLVSQPLPYQTGVFLIGTHDQDFGAGASRPGA